MAFQWMRRVLLALAPAALLAVAGCSSGSIESQFKPTRAIAFGDALTDMGNTGSRFTVNDSQPTWVAQTVADYFISINKSATAGGLNYATGNARVIQKPDAAGSNTTPTIKEQIDTFLASNSFNGNDLVVIQGGLSDMVVLTQAYRAGTITSDQLIASARQAGSDLAAQTKRLVAAGATHVVLIGVYDFARTPWAAAIGQQNLLSSASTAFNTGLLVDLVDQGDKVLYIDTAFEFNLMVNNPTAFGFTDSTTVVCTSVDPGPGIGIGTGMVSSAKCTPTTVVDTTNYSLYFWADAVYPGPLAQMTFSSYVYSKVHNRW